MTIILAWRTIQPILQYIPSLRLVIYQKQIIDLPVVFYLGLEGCYHLLLQQFLILLVVHVIS